MDPEFWVGKRITLKGTLHIDGGGIRWEGQAGTIVAVAAVEGFGDGAFYDIRFDDGVVCSSFWHGYLNFPSALELLGETA